MCEGLPQRGGPSFFFRMRHVTASGQSGAPFGGDAARFGVGGDEVV